MSLKSDVFSDVTHVGWLKFTYFSEELAASIFSIQEYTMQKIVWCLRKRMDYQVLWPSQQETRFSVVKQGLGVGRYSRR
jgi:hypothetical protein